MRRLDPYSFFFSRLAFRFSFAVCLGDFFFSFLASRPFDKILTSYIRNVTVALTEVIIKAYFGVNATVMLREVSAVLGRGAVLRLERCPVRPV